MEKILPNPTKQKFYLEVGVKFILLENSKIVGFLKDCPICNKEFQTPQPRTKTCSKECTTKSRSNKIKNLPPREPWNKGKTGIYSEEVRKSMGFKNLGRVQKKSHKKKISKGLKKYYKNNDNKLKGSRLRESHKNKIKKSLFEIKQFRTKYTYSELLEFCKTHEIKLLSQSNENRPISQDDRAQIECSCGNVYDTRIQHIFSYPQKGCRKCSLTGISKKELDLRNFIKSIIDQKDLDFNSRPPFMEGLELDIYSSKHKLAIEFHGLAHHSERPVWETKDLTKIKTQHRKKFELCETEGVRLIQIFEDEWDQKPEIVKSIIRNRLGKSKRVYARKCQIKLVTSELRSKFFEENHISGDVQASKAWGLFLDSELISCISIRKPWTKKYGKVFEIARFASKLNTTVVGGFSKLLKKLPRNLLTYADLRFGMGEVYSKNGFTYVSRTQPNYFYEKGGVRESRFKHRKSSKLIGSTEREQQNRAGWYAIYDVGSNVFIKN